MDDSIIANWTAYSSGGMKWPVDGTEEGDAEKAATIGSLNTLRRTVADRVIAWRESTARDGRPVMDMQETLNRTECRSKAGGEMLPGWDGRLRSEGDKHEMPTVLSVLHMGIDDLRRNPLAFRPVGERVNLPKA